MRRGAAAAALSGLVVLLAVWVTGTSSAGLMPNGPGPRHVETLPMLRHARHVRAHHASPQQAKPTGAVPLGFVIVGDVLLGAIGLGLLVFLVSAFLRRTRRRRQRATPPSGDFGDSIAALGITPRIEEAARRQLRAVTEGSPRNAIVACWMELERACAEGGLPRAPAETSTEFTARVLAQQAVGAATIDTLASLYREARFSEHRLTEAHRATAVDALDALLRDLREPPYAGVSGSGSGIKQRST